MTGTLFGREPETALLARILDDTAAGLGSRHVLVGPPGIGKSHLLRTATAMAAARGISVAAREAFRLDRAAPLVTLAGALRDSGPEFAWLAGHQAHADPLATLHRLRSSLEQAARTRPLLIVIDDAQWMDELSALAVRELVPALASSPVCWLFAHRPPTPGSTAEPGSPAVGWLRREPAGTIQLGVLDDDAVARLCAETVGAPVDNTVVALAASCGGNPLRTGQLLRALLATGQLVVADGIASVVGAELPSSFVDSVREVLDAVTEPTGWLLRAAAVFGRPFDLDEIARLMDVEASKLLPLLDEAMAGFLVDDDGRLAFAHDLVRDAVYSMLRAPVREQLHRRVAELAREQGRPALEVASHQLRSGRTGAADALALIRSVVREIARVAPAAAADFMLRALDEVGPHEPARPALIVDTVGLLASAARLVEARRLGEEALAAGLDPESEALLLLGLAEACKHAGANEAAVRYADRGLAPDGVSAGTRARLYAIRAHALHYAGDPDAADESGARSAELGHAGAEFGAAVLGLTARSLVAAAAGRLSDALTHAGAATELADRHDDDVRRQHPRIWLGSAYTGLDRFDEAAAALRTGRIEGRRLGSAWAEPLWHYYQTELHLARGRLDDAAVEAESGLAVAEQLATTQLMVPLLGQLVRLAVLRGDLAGAQRRLEHMRRFVDDGVTAAPEDILWAEATVMEASGAHAAAFAVLREMYEQLPRRPALIVADPTAAAQLVRLAARAGRLHHAALVVAAARSLAGRNPGSHAAAGAAAHADGLLRGDAGLLLRAAEEYGRAGRPLARATALADAAEQARASVPRATVTDWYDEALTVLTDRGAVRTGRRLTDRLGDWRGRASLPAVPEREPDCLPRLSPAERRVAHRVAQGRTNTEVAAQLHISRHTVDAHLRSIFGKLGVRRRVELAGLVARECGNHAST